MSTTIREVWTDSRPPRVYGFMSKRLAVIAIRLLVSVNLLYAAIFLKFAGVPGSVGPVPDVAGGPRPDTQPVFRLGSGVFETIVAVLFLIPKTARLASRLVILWMTAIILSPFSCWDMGVL